MFIINLKSLAQELFLLLIIIVVMAGLSFVASYVDVIEGVGTTVVVIIVFRNILKYLRRQYLKRHQQCSDMECQRVTGNGMITESKVFLREVFPLHATLEHEQPLWGRIYPFHIGLYLWFGCFVLELIRVAHYFVNFLALLESVGSICIVIGVILIRYRRGGNRLLTASFLVLGLLGLAVWFVPLGVAIGMPPMQILKILAVISTWYSIVSFLLVLYVLTRSSQKNDVP